MQFKTKVLMAMGLSAFAIWSGMAYFNETLRDDYAQFVISVTMGVSALALRDLPGKDDPKPEVKPTEVQQ